eukprot:TRINITY_DN18530_c2_g3_i2.p1 TRINITY_DN18530_c2_g3~~TRINITY_DN18530_c2_g3_i2.p1  ORF type:complete len:108 (-),score=6.43 TRINITY_DN18530_c2_g3_i2:592-915(-)
MKLGFPIEVRPRYRLSSLWRYIVSSGTCFGTHCAFSTPLASPKPMDCINWYKSRTIPDRWLDYPYPSISSSPSIIPVPFPSIPNRPSTNPSSQIPPSSPISSPPSSM